MGLFRRATRRDSFAVVGSVLASRLRAAYEHLADGVVVTHPDGRIVYINAAFERASGCRAEQAFSHTLTELLSPRALSDEADVFAMTRADGAEYFVRRTKATLDPILGDAPLLLEVHRDVTAERALRKSEALFRKLTECSTELISRADKNARCIYISPSCREVLGYEPEELAGRVALVELAHPEDLAERQKVREQFVERGVTSGSPVRMRVRRKDGTYVWLETLTHIERDADGRILEVQSWARDVSARVAAEQALARSQGTLRSLLERLPAGVCVLREDVVLFANDALAKITGHACAEDLVGQSILDIVHPSEREEVAARVKERTSVASRKRRVIAQDGSERTVDITVVPLLFEGELRFVAIVRDVTEHAEMERRLAHAERLALVGRLASGVGHEINNPLAYMLGSIELARTDLTRLAHEQATHEPLDRLARHLVTLREGAERVRDIVRDLKLLSAAGDDRLGPVDVERVLDQAAATVHHEIRQRARLVTDYRGVPPALSNEGRLAQVFVNLLLNAAQAIPEGGVEENEIRITTCEASGYVVVEIRDTGVGIAAQDLPRIFEPFFTTKSSGVGTGLGLSISHTIVTAHGGKITAERASPRGALFRVELRVAPEEVASPPSRTSNPIDGTTARVLVVDDDPHAARVVAELLAPHDVKVAHSGREALAQLERDPSFDAIVCDLQMNDGTGVDVYEHLVARKSPLADRLIFITGGAFTERARAFLDRCPRPVLEKPFEAPDLHAMVRALSRLRDE